MPSRAKPSWADPMWAKWGSAGAVHYQPSHGQQLKERNRHGKFPPFPVRRACQLEVCPTLTSDNLIFFGILMLHFSIPDDFHHVPPDSAVPMRAPAAVTCAGMASATLKSAAPTAPHAPAAPPPTSPPGGSRRTCGTPSPVGATRPWSDSIWRRG